MALGNTQGTNDQLLLTPRQYFCSTMGCQTQSEIRPLWACLGMANLLITVQGSGQHFVQLALLVPAAVITEDQTFQLQQFAQRAFENGFQGLDIGSAVTIDFVAGEAQLTVPGRLRSGVKCTMPQPRVPLPQGLLQALPGRHKARFHVEHSPVEKLPTNLGRAFQQAETVRVDQLQWQGLGQLGSTARILPIDANLQLALTVTGNAQTALPTIGQPNFAENRTGRLLILNHRQ